MSTAALMTTDSRQVLVAHPCDNYCETLILQGMKLGYVVRRCQSCSALKRLAKQQPARLVVLELRLEDGPTLGIIEWLKERYPATEIVVVTNYGSIAAAVRCARVGVNGFYPERVPFDTLLNATIDWKKPSDGRGRAVPLRLDRAMWEYLHRVAERAGSITVAAKMLGVDRRSLRRMLAKYPPPP